MSEPLTREVDIALLYSALDTQRETRGLSWRAVAAQTGLSASTFSRMTNGHEPSLSGFVVMCRWLQMPIETFVRRPAEVVESSFETEFVGLLNRHQVQPADQEFLWSVTRSLVKLKHNQREVHAATSAPCPHG